MQDNRINQICKRFAGTYRAHQNLDTDKMKCTYCNKRNVIKYISSAHDTGVMSTWMKSEWFHCGCCGILYRAETHAGNGIKYKVYISVPTMAASVIEYKKGE